MIEIEKIKREREREKERGKKKGMEFDFRLPVFLIREIERESTSLTSPKAVLIVLITLPSYLVCRKVVVVVIYN